MSVMFCYISAALETESGDTQHQLQTEMEAMKQTISQAESEANDLKKASTQLMDSLDEEKVQIYFRTMKRWMQCNDS